MVVVVNYSRCTCVHVQVHVVHKKDFKVYKCTCVMCKCSMRDKFSRLCL